MSAGAVAAAPRRGRGRPAARWWSVDEVAELLDVPRARVLRALAPAWRASFFPGARSGADDAWEIPDRDVRALVGVRSGEPPVLLSVERFAELIGFSRPWIYQLIRAGVVKPRRVLGFMRVPASEYWALPEERPACVAARPLFFGAENAGAGDGRKEGDR